MLNFFFWVGIALVAMSIIVLLYMAQQAKKLNSAGEKERKSIGSRILMLNYLGLGLGVFGLAIVFISLILNS